MNTLGQIRIVADSDNDAQLIETLLRDEYGSTRCTITSSDTVTIPPSGNLDVMVLSLKPIERAEVYANERRRVAGKTGEGPVYIIVLCEKLEVQRAFALCKGGCFDDYVLFWPLTNDAPRLAMAVHKGLRYLSMGTESLSFAQDWSVPARNLGVLEAKLDDYTHAGKCLLGVVDSSLDSAEQRIDAALERISSKLAAHDRKDSSGIYDQTAIHRELSRIKVEEIGKGFKAVSAAMSPVHRWAEGVKQFMEPQLESARTLQRLALDCLHKILIAEADPFQRKLLANALKGTRYRPIFVQSGAEAQLQMHEQRPALAILEANLPDISGVDLLRAIKADDAIAGIPVVLISEVGEKHMVYESQRAGAADFVVKPFERDILLEKLARCLALP